MTAQKEAYNVKMAKASKEEWQALLDFFQNLEEMVEQDPWNSEIGEYVVDKMHGDVGASYNRVLWGFVTLITNVCDPELTYLELKPELRNLVAERDQARNYRNTWKWAAKAMRAKWKAVRRTAINYHMDRVRAIRQRDEARRIARHYYWRAVTLDDSRIEAAAAESDAVQRAQEAEAELREARRQRDEARREVERRKQVLIAKRGVEAELVKRAEKAEAELREARKKLGTIRGTIYYIAAAAYGKQDAGAPDVTPELYNIMEAVRPVNAQEAPEHDH